MIRITRVQVDQYRGLRDTDLKFGADGETGITVLLGPNEAGKSTLLEFVREVLFGSGAVRGSVTLTASGRRYRVSAEGRRARQVTDLETGETCPPATARELLGAVDEQVFRNVFAFGLTELQSLSSLTAQGVQDRIFSAGVAGAGPSARAALAQLDRDVLEYLRPRALSRLTGGAHAYAEIRRLVREHQGQAAQYVPKQERREELQDAIQSEGAVLAGLQARQSDLERLQRLWPQWAQRLDAEARLRDLPDVPPGAEAALADAQARAQDLRQLTGQIGTLEGELSALPAPRPDLTEAAPRLEALASELAAHRERERQAGDVQARHDALRRLLDEQRAALPEAARALTLTEMETAPLLQRVNDFDHALTQAAADLRERRRASEGAQQDLDRAVTEAAARPAPGPLDAPPATPDEAALREALQAAQERLEEAQRASGEHQPDRLLLAELPALQQAVDQAPIAALAALPSARQALAQRRDALREKLAELSGWDEARLAAVTSETEHLWREEGQGHARAWADAHRAEEGALAALASRRAAQHDADLHAASLPGGPALQDLDAQVQDLRDQLTLTHVLQANLQAAGAPAGTITRPAPWRVWAGLALTALLTLAAFPVHPGLAALALLAGLALTALLRVPAGPVRQGGAPATPDLTADFKTLKLPPHSGPAEVAALASRLTLQLGDLDRERTAATNRDDAQRAARTAQALTARAETAVEEAARHTKAAQADFTRWAAEQQLPLTRPGDLDGFLLRVTSARDLAAQVNTLMLEVQALEQGHRTFVQAAQPLLARTGLEGGTGDILADLRGALGRALEARRDLQRQEDAAQLVLARTEDLRREQDRLTDLRRVQALRHAEAVQVVQDRRAALALVTGHADEAARAWEDGQRNWEAFLAEAGLPQVVPGAAHGILEQQARVAATERALQDKAANLARVHEQLGAYLTEVAEVAAALQEHADPSGLPALLAEARDAVAHSAQRAALHVTLAGLQAALKQAREALTGALGAVGAPDLPTLERWCEISRERARLKEVIHQSDRDLHLLAGQDEGRLREALNAAQPAVWQEEQGRLAEAADAHRQMIEAAHARAAELNFELGQLADAEASAVSQLHLEAQREQLRLDARAWMVRRLAATLLESTLKEYERTKGPEVLRHASEVFGQITRGRYVAVRQVDGSASFRAISDRDHAVDVQELSRGTQEQLYLAVRLGLARALGQRTARLPLVMDDILVNADPDRAAAVAAALADVAQDHQILYLTCHPANAELLAQASAGTQVMTLPRLGPVPQALTPAEPLEKTVFAGIHGDVREYLSTLNTPVKMGDLRRALPHLGDDSIRAQLRDLEQAQELIKDGQKKGTRYSLAFGPVSFPSQVPLSH